jgi:uncharacterized membrane-anchored protein YjiN (DUF445 family)
MGFNPSAALHAGNGAFMTQLLVERAGVDPARGLRRLATGLLILAAALLVLARSQEGSHWAWGYVRAFAEAALIGGLADWFAVTAVFRRPFGLPIPHTAVIPRNKDRIADSLASFVADNFLGPALVGERLGRMDMVALLAERMRDPDQAKAAAEAVSRALPALLDTVDDEAVAAFLRRQTDTEAFGAALSPALGMGIEAFLKQGRHHALIDTGLQEAWTLLSENQQKLRERVRDNTSWLWRIIKLDERAADAMVGALEDTIQEAAGDPNHPLRERVGALLHKAAEDLRTAPHLQARVQRFLTDLLSHPSARDAIGEALLAMKAAVRADANAPDSRMRAAAADLIVGLGQGLLDDNAARQALNERVTALAVDLASRHGRDVASVVSDTVRGWDAETLSAKLEQGVGRDLQYIRLNGTLIGGLIGAGLHFVFSLSPAG